MSIKIYYGCRFPLDRINDGIDFIHDKMWLHTSELISKFGVSNRTELLEFVTNNDLSCGFNMWIYNQYCYVVPIGIHGILEKTFKKVPNFIENFSYWDNVDKPNKVSQKVWDSRCSTWDSICLGELENKSDHNSRRLYHEVFDSKNFKLVSNMSIFLDV
jgi:hypothetical protein